MDKDLTISELEESLREMNVDPDHLVNQVKEKIREVINRDALAPLVSV